MPNLTGKSVLITGAGGSIGLAIVDKLASEGADFVINDMSQESAAIAANIACEHGVRAVTNNGNVTVENDVEGMVDLAVNEYEKLDIVIANAGLHITTELVNTSRAQFQRIQDVNVWGVYLTNREAAKQMIKQGFGKIINAASLSGHRATELQSVYNASKYAVVGITHAVATELAPHGITCNAYCPGMVDSAMWDGIDAERARILGVPEGQPREQALKKIPLGRMAKTDDVAGLVKYLASSDSDYITGQAIQVCGGAFMQ
tara:strand:- start:1117 stop:1896 length:780 start_codon:yes stop_codon:yes gene_type:complete